MSGFFDINVQIYADISSYVMSYVMIYGVKIAGDVRNVRNKPL
jgi:hypothetical protein